MYLYGIHTLAALLQHEPARVTKLFVQEAQGRPEPRLAALVQQAQSHGIITVRCPKTKLDALVRQAHEDDDPPLTHLPSHQGVVGVVASKPLLHLDEWLPTLDVTSTPPPLIVAMDGVEDPRNLGAMLRVADGLGVAGVLLPKHRNATLSPSVAKTAAGAEQSVPLVAVTNLGQALRACKDAGFWIVGGVCGTTYPQAVAPWAFKAGNTPLVLVMGNEEKGLRPTTIKDCDFLLTLPMLGQVASYNVSTALAMLAYELVVQQRYGQARLTVG